MPSSTSSSRGSRRSAAPGWAPQLALFALGLAAGLVPVWGLDRAGLWAWLSVDPAIGSKWMPGERPRSFEFHLLPSVPTGEVFRRRPGPSQESGRVLAVGAEEAGFFEHPYGGLPEVHVSRGRHGFRDEYPAEPGGTALLGSSFVEAGFASAEDSIAGWLRRDHGIPASNFGVAWAGGYTVLHYVERYVLPTRPAELVWVFAGQADFATLEREADALARAAPARRPLLPGLPAYLAASGAGFAESAWLRAASASRRALEALSLRAEARTASRDPERHRGVIRVSDRRVAVDALLLGRPESFHAARPQVADVLTRLGRLAREQRVGVSVVYIPSRFRLLEGRWLRPPPGTPDLPDGAAFVEAECAARGIAFRDTTPALRALLDAGILPINPIHDQHLSPAGMQAVARVIAELLAVQERAAQGARPAEAGRATRSEPEASEARSD